MAVKWEDELTKLEEKDPSLAIMSSTASNDEVPTNSDMMDLLHNKEVNIEINQRINEDLAQLSKKIATPLDPKLYDTKPTTNIITTLQLAKAGEPSSFPEWLSSELRDKQLIDKELEYFKKGITPPTGNPKEIRAYNEIKAQIETANGVEVSQPLGDSEFPILKDEDTSTEVPSEEVKPISSELESLTEKIMKYKNAEEFVDKLDIDKNLEKAYTILYGQKARDTFREFGEIYGGKELLRTTRRRAIEGLRRNIETNLSRLFRTIKENPEGFTLKIDGTPATSGYAVSPFKERETILDFENLNEETLENFLLKNKDIYTTRKDAYIDGWLDKETNKFYLDASIVLDDLEKAIGFGIRGKQIAIFDLGKLEEIRTKDFLKNKFIDLYNQVVKGVKEVNPEAEKVSEVKPISTEPEESK
ncbi:MAG: hypothetical protein ACPLW7_04430 [Minisyncoccia bacterium]